MLALIMRLVTVVLVLTCASAIDHMHPHESHDHLGVSAVALMATTADKDVLLPARTAESPAIVGSRGGEHEHDGDVCSPIATPPQATGIVVEVARSTVDDFQCGEHSPGADLRRPAAGERCVLLETGVCRT